MSTFKIGILGFGTVGSGVFKVLQSNHEEILEKTGIDFKINSILDIDSNKVNSITGDKKLIANDLKDLIASSDVVLELIGGTTIAYEFAKEVIDAKKHLVTANKALIAMHGTELFKLAKDNNVSILYEASVAGGIPIIKALREGVVSNKVEWVAGILNGTTNYIITEMKDNGLSFDTALSQAQELGYAEADPTFDIEGIDAAHKITIIASIAFGISLNFKDVFVEGLTKLELKDVSYAEELGYKIKLIGLAKKINDNVEVRVHPTLIPSSNLVANVDGPMNAVLVMGNMLGPTMYYGAGAGSEPTASAVLTDVIDLARSLDQGGNVFHVPSYGFLDTNLKNIKFTDIKNINSSYYLRGYFSETKAALDDVKKIFAEKNISINVIDQKMHEKNDGDLIIITNDCTESVIDEIIDQIKSLKANAGDLIKIRLEKLS